MKNDMQKPLEVKIAEYAKLCRHTPPEELKDIIRSPYIKDELKAVLIKVLESRPNNSYTL